MIIAFDSQILFERQKTGIGRNSEEMIDHYIKLKSDNVILNYFKMFDAKNREKVILKYKEDSNVKINKCVWFHNVLFHKLNKYIPLPYSIFFHKKVDITQFFNYVVPPGVKGKVSLYVYDMAYRVYPETIGQATLDMLNRNLVNSCNRTDLIVTISEFSKKEIIKYLNVSEEKIAVVPCAVDSSIYNQQIDYSELKNVKKKFGISKEYFFYLGTLEPRKNIERLIEAYAMLIKRNDADKTPLLVLAGKNGWNYEEIYSKVKALGLESYVIFTGYIDASEAVILLKGAYTFVFPSIYEGFGLPPLEAMACGVPVITSNVTSLPEVVGDAGYLVDPFSINEICDAMIQITNDENERERLKAKGIERAKYFTWERSARLLQEAYKKII